MSRFFFNLIGADPDDLGVELASAEEARSAAISFLGAHLADDPEYAQQGHWRVEVTEAAGRVLFSVVVAVVDPSSRTRA